MSILKKNKNIAGVLAIFLGTLGIHRFYMGEWKVGLAYLLFFWTGVPTILGIIDGARYFTELADEAPDVDSVNNTESSKDSETNLEKAESSDINESVIEEDNDNTIDKDTNDYIEESIKETGIESDDSMEENQEDK